MPIAEDGETEFKGYLARQNVDALIDWGNRNKTRRCDHEFPYLHRITDLVSGDCAIRVSRCAACAEQIFVKVINSDIADPAQPGVPYELSGKNLQRWIADELENPSMDPTDWSEYLADPDDSNARLG